MNLNHYYQSYNSSATANYMMYTLSWTSFTVHFREWKRRKSHAEKQRNIYSISFEKKGFRGVEGVLIKNAEFCCSHMFMKALKIGKTKMLQECAFPEALVYKWKNNIMVEDKNQFWAQSILLFFRSSSRESKTAPLCTNKFKYLLREKDEVEEEADRSCSHSSLGL